MDISSVNLPPPIRDFVDFSEMMTGMVCVSFLSLCLNDSLISSYRTRTDPYHNLWTYTLLYSAVFILEFLCFNAHAILLQFGIC